MQIRVFFLIGFQLKLRSWCGFHCCLTGPGKDPGFAEAACILPDRAAVFIHINLADSADGPAVDMGGVFTGPEGSRDDEFRIFYIVNQFTAGSFCQIHDRDPVSLIGIDQAYGGPLQSDLVVAQGEDPAICWQQ